MLEGSYFGKTKLYLSFSYIIFKDEYVDKWYLLMFNSQQFPQVKEK